MICKPMYTMHITLMNYAYSFNRHSKSDISRNIATYNQGAEKGGLMVSSLASTFFGIFETFLTICSIYYSNPPLAYNDELLLPTLNQIHVLMFEKRDVARCKGHKSGNKEHVDSVIYRIKKLNRNRLYHKSCCVLQLLTSDLVCKKLTIQIYNGIITNQIQM